jgi:hypothetical protein
MFKRENDILHQFRQAQMAQTFVKCYNVIRRSPAISKTRNIGTPNSGTPKQHDSGARNTKRFYFVKNYGVGITVGIIIA